MSRREIRVDGLAVPISHFTDAVQAGDLLFVSGIVAVDREGRLVGGEDVVAEDAEEPGPAIEPREADGQPGEDDRGGEGDHDAPERTSDGQ